MENHILQSGAEGGDLMDLVYALVRCGESLNTPDHLEYLANVIRYLSLSDQSWQSVHHLRNDKATEEILQPTIPHVYNKLSAKVWADVSKIRRHPAWDRYQKWIIQVIESETFDFWTVFIACTDRCHLIDNCSLISRQLFPRSGLMSSASSSQRSPYSPHSLVSNASIRPFLTSSNTLDFSRNSAIPTTRLERPGAGRPAVAENLTSPSSTLLSQNDGEWKCDDCPKSYSYFGSYLNHRCLRHNDESARQKLNAPTGQKPGPVSPASSRESVPVGLHAQPMALRSATVVTNQQPQRARKETIPPTDLETFATQALSVWEPKQTKRPYSGIHDHRGSFFRPDSPTLPSYSDLPSHTYSAVLDDEYNTQENMNLVPGRATNRPYTDVSNSGDANYTFLFEEPDQTQGLPQPY
jgi:hypothetical protein